MCQNEYLLFKIVEKRESLTTIDNTSKHAIIHIKTDKRYGFSECSTIDFFQVKNFQMNVYLKRSVISVMTYYKTYIRLFSKC